MSCDDPFGDAHFLLGLEKAGVDFVAADMPHANRLTVGIMALVAWDMGLRSAEVAPAQAVLAHANGAWSPDGQSIAYDAAGDSSQRQAAIQAWRRLIPEGQVPPAPKKKPTPK